jgi:hypothetical protein
MRKILGIAVVAALFAAGTAEAQAPAKSESGFTMGLRLGYGIPMGDFISAVSMDEFLGGKIPIWVDLGYRLDRSMFIGAYFQYAFGTAAGTYDALCTASGVDCTPSILRIGAEFLYKLMPDASFAPWVGIGIGYEVVTFTESAGGASGSTDASGFEFVNLQLGGDFKVGSNFALGPYVALSVAQYSSVGGVTGFEKGTHEWLQFGLKGTFDL